MTWKDVFKFFVLLIGSVGFSYLIDGHLPSGETYDTIAILAMAIVILEAIREKNSA